MREGVVRGFVEGCCCYCCEGEGEGGAERTGAAVEGLVEQFAGYLGDCVLRGGRLRPYVCIEGYVRHDRNIR